MKFSLCVFLDQNLFPYHIFLWDVAFQVKIMLKRLYFSIDLNQLISWFLVRWSQRSGIIRCYSFNSKVRFTPLFPCICLLWILISTCHIIVNFINPFLKVRFSKGISRKQGFWPYLVLDCNQIWSTIRWNILQDYKMYKALMSKPLYYWN